MYEESPCQPQHPVPVVLTLPVGGRGLRDGVDFFREHCRDQLPRKRGRMDCQL
jgi:hypothetical protein